MWVGRTPNLRYGIVRCESFGLAVQGTSVSDMGVGRTPNLRYGIVRCESFVLAVQATKRIRYVGGANTEPALRNRAV